MRGVEAYIMYMYTCMYVIGGVLVELYLSRVVTNNCGKILKNKKGLGMRSDKNLYTMFT